MGKEMQGAGNSVLDNGGAMGLLNDATGGLAMTLKDAVSIPKKPRNIGKKAWFSLHQYDPASSTSTE